MLCGYLDADLKAVADDILLESHGEPLGEIEARDLRKEPAPRARAEAPSADEPEPRATTRTFEPELEYEPNARARTTRPELDAEPDDRRSSRP